MLTYWCQTGTFIYCKFSIFIFLICWCSRVWNIWSFSVSVEATHTDIHVYTESQNNLHFGKMYVRWLTSLVRAFAAYGAYSGTSASCWQAKTHIKNVHEKNKVKFIFLKHASLIQMLMTLQLNLFVCSVRLSVDNGKNNQKSKNDLNTNVQISF